MVSEKPEEYEVLFGLYTFSGIFHHQFKNEASFFLTVSISTSDCLKDVNSIMK